MYLFSRRGNGKSNAFRIFYISLYVAINCMHQPLDLKFSLLAYLHQGTVKEAKHLYQHENQSAHKNHSLLSGGAWVPSKWLRSDAEDEFERDSD